MLFFLILFYFFLYHLTFQGQKTRVGSSTNYYGNKKYSTSENIQEYYDDDDDDEIVNVIMNKISQLIRQNDT